MFFLLSTIKKFHSEIVFVVWLRDVRSKIVYLFFTRKHFYKVLKLSVIYFPVFLLKISSAFAIIFVDCQGLSCVHVRARWYTAPFRVSLRGVGPRCVGLARKVPSRCKTDSCMFFTFYLFVFLLSFLALSHMYVILIPSACSRTGQNWNLFYQICFKKPLLFITLFLKIMRFHLLFISIRTWN